MIKSKLGKILILFRLLIMIGKMLKRVFVTKDNQLIMNFNQKRIKISL